MRYDFGSDNTAGMAPAALQGLIENNAGFARAYGADDVTARAAEQIRRRLDADAEIAQRRLRQNRVAEVHADRHDHRGDAVGQNLAA